MRASCLPAVLCLGRDAKSDASAIVYAIPGRQMLVKVDSRYTPEVRGLAEASPVTMGAASAIISIIHSSRRQYAMLLGFTLGGAEHRWLNWQIALVPSKIHLAMPIEQIVCVFRALRWRLAGHAQELCNTQNCHGLCWQRSGIAQVCAA